MKQKNMRGEIPPEEWEKLPDSEKYVEPWAPIPFLLIVGGSALFVAFIFWVMT